MQEYIQISDKDNVVVAIRDIDSGSIIKVDGRTINVKGNIRQGHKIAIQDLYKGDMVIKYGSPIGQATDDIGIGKHIHTHNIRTNLDGKLDYIYNPQIHEEIVTEKCREFQGYKRKDGDVGIRNELWIVPTVGCVNGIGELMIKEMKTHVISDEIDGIHIFKHNYGCSQLGDDHNNTVKILRDIVKHPNAGGVLVLGLGCENNQIEEFKQGLGKYDSDRIKFLVAQDVEDEIEAGIRILSDLAVNMSKDARESCSISELKVGLKCGGSDGFSGITANPLLGRFSDYLIGCGGTTVLTEVPEMFGAEQLLMNRCKEEGTFKDTVSMINGFKDYFISNNQEIYENPSPGNKAGGITTLEEKSLGCTQKSGTSGVVDVLEYGEQVTTKGLNLLSAPGNDLVATTALGSAGCQMVLFTTGRGTPFGSFVPTIKISSNTDLYNKKVKWMDFNAGVLLEDVSIEQLNHSFVDLIIDIANGKKAKNEELETSDIAIFKTGVTL